MTQQPKLIKKAKIVDNASVDAIKSKSLADEIARLENRYRQQDGQAGKTNELLFELLREMDKRLLALEK